MKKLIVILLLCVFGFLFLLPASAEEASPALILSETEVRIAVGKNAALKATVENPPSGKKGKAAWESSDPAVCTVSPAGAVKAVSEGTAVVTCTMTFPEGETLTAECKVTTFVEAKTLKAVNAAVRLNVGETAAAEYELLPENTTEKTLEWSSADEAIVTVNAEGQMTGVAPGTTKITAVTKDGSSRKAVFTVYVPTLAVPETEYTISELSGLTIPVSYYGDDFENNVSVKVSGKPVLYTTQYENNRIELHLDALEAGDSQIEIVDKKDKNASITLTVHMEETALCNNTLLEITSAGFKWKKGELYLSISGSNHTSRKITRVYFALDFRTQSGEQLFYSTTANDHAVPALYVFWYGSNKNPFQINAFSKSSHSFYPTNSGERLTDQKIEEIRIAIDRIEFDDDTAVNIPDSQKYWFSTVSGYLNRPVVTANYTYPPQEIFDKANTISLGFEHVSVESFTKPWYGVSETGFYVVHVVPGSIAEQCGLQEKDLVFEANGLSYAEDLNFIPYANAKIADGESVIFKVLRDGEVVELEFHQ